MTLWNRHGLRLAIHGRCRRENEPRNFVLEHHAQQSECAQRVVIEILLGNLDRLARLNQRSEMHHGIEAMSGEERIERGFVPGVSLDKFS